MRKIFLLPLGLLLVWPVAMSGEFKSEDYVFLQVRRGVDKGILSIRTQPNFRKSDNIIGMIGEGHIYSVPKSIYQNLSPEVRRLGSNYRNWRGIPVEGEGEGQKIYMNIGERYSEVVSGDGRDENQDGLPDGIPLYSRTRVTDLYEFPGTDARRIGRVLHDTGANRGVGAPIVFQGSKIVMETNPATGAKEARLYYRGTFAELLSQPHHKRPQFWVPASQVTTDVEQRYEPVEEAPIAMEDCPPDDKVLDPGKEHRESRIPEDFIPQLDLDKTFESIAPHIGTCVIDAPRDQIPKPKVNKSGHRQFEDRLLPHWKSFNFDRAEVNSVFSSPVADGGSGVSSESLSPQQIVDVDILARTIYGEMAKKDCFNPDNLSGLHNFKAVARIILNRSDSDKPKGGKGLLEKYGGKPFDGVLGPLAAASLQPQQFSVWDPNVQRKIVKTNSRGVPYDAFIHTNPGIRQVMCPPARAEEKFWTGGKPPPNESKIWEHCVKVALQAVVTPEKFKQETKSLEGIFHYTSNLSYSQLPKWAKDKKISKRVYPKLQGNSFAGQCLQLWQLDEKYL